MIPVDWNPATDFPRVEFVLFVPGLMSAARLMSAIIDTGAVATTIHPTDAKFALGISMDSLNPANWADVVTMTGITGAGVYGEFDAVYAFFDEAGELETMVESRVLVAQPTAENATVPSLLGWDLLERFEMHALGREWMTLEPL